MKRIYYTIFLLSALFSATAVAQNTYVQENEDGTIVAVDEPDTNAPAPQNPRFYLGVRGGLNLADMHFSRSETGVYSHTLVPSGMFGLFAHFPLGDSQFSLRPEVSYVGRGVKLHWWDVDYRMRAHYLDFRLPLTFNFKTNGNLSPYIMMAPNMGLAFGGKIEYSDYLYTSGVSTDITEANINPVNFGLLLGAGIDYYFTRWGYPLLLSLEAGYNLGFRNIFAEREIFANPDFEDDERSNILNKFFGAELWQGSRRTGGIEIAARVAVPFFKKVKPTTPMKYATPAPKFPKFEVNLLTSNPDQGKVNPEGITVKDSGDYFTASAFPTKGNEFVEWVTPDGTVVSTENPYGFIVTEDITLTGRFDSIEIPKPHIPDTLVVGGVEYVVKDCYSLREIAAFIELGIDISDKRICMYNINFDFDKSTLRPESYEPLSEMLVMMNFYPEMEVEVYGHTDSIGTDEYNQALSERRAQAVVDYFTKNGIAKRRIHAKGFGEMIPIDTNSTPEGRFRNRRVEFELLNIGTKKQ